MLARCEPAGSAEVLGGGIHHYRALARIGDAVSVVVRGAAGGDFPRVRQVVQVAVGLAGIGDAVRVSVGAGAGGDVAAVREGVGVAVGEGFAGFADAVVVAVELVGVGGGGAVVEGVGDAVGVRVNTRSSLFAAVGDAIGVRVGDIAREDLAVIDDVVVVAVGGPFNRVAGN